MPDVKDPVVHVRIWKHKKTQHALVGLGSATLAAAVALLRLGGAAQISRKGLINKVYKKKARSLNGL